MSTLDFSQQFPQGKSTFPHIVLKMNALKLGEYLRYGDK